MKTYYVKGMHCPSCEVLIEKSILELEEVESVDADTGRGTIRITYTKEPSIKKINETIKEDGYQIGETRFRDQGVKKSCRVVKEKKDTTIKGKFFNYLQVGGAVILITTAFIFLIRSPLASSIMVSSSSAIPAFILFGLISGFSSCAALIGGLVLSMSKQWGEMYAEEGTFWSKIQPHLMLNLGRIWGFGLLGGLLGVISGQALQISTEIAAFITIGISIIMAILALQMLGVKQLRKFQLRLPKNLLHFITEAENFKGKYMPLILGVLTFFIPCGFTLTVQSLALMSGSFSQGFLMMAAFAIGTAPMLLLIGFSSAELTSRPHLSGKFLKVGGFLVLLFAFYNLNSQLNVLGLKSINDLGITNRQTIAQENKDLPPIVNGKQIIKMKAKSYEYQPNEFKVRVDMPVRWEVEDAGISGCTNAIVAKGLFKGEFPLNNKVNIKEFTPREKGNYKFSCWMGMVTGVMQVVDSSGEVEEKIIPSGAESGSCGGGCSGSCGGGCGNPTCQFKE